MVTKTQVIELLKLHGDVRPQPASDWKGPFAIPPAVEVFYREVGPMDVSIEGYGNPYFLPRLSALWRFQAGYRNSGRGCLLGFLSTLRKFQAGRRQNSLAGEPIEDWNDDWLVVADEGGDPFILSRATGEVLHAYHGEGKWDVARMFPDLDTMAACLAQLGAIVLEAGDAFTDKDCLIRAEHRQLASIKLQSFLGSATTAEVVLESLSWG